MIIKLLNYTPLDVADIAICKCYGNEPHSDIEKVKKRIDRVANVSKHASTIEHLNFSFDIDGISRACLQELARHRIASYTVRSSRYTLQELKSEDRLYTTHPIDCLTSAYDYEQECTREEINYSSKYIVLTNNEMVNAASLVSLENLRQLIINGVPNDVAKYCMPEAYKTSLVMTINARALQNFLSLRTSKHALKEIQELARAMFEAIPESHKFLFEGCLND